MTDQSATFDFATKIIHGSTEPVERLQGELLRGSVPDAFEMKHSAA
jgi:hypothetical protein